MKAKRSMKKKTRSVFVTVIALVANNAERVIPSLHKIRDTLNQFSGKELLIVDNASTDNSLVLLQKFQKMAQETRILVLSRHIDTEHALSAGFDHAIGDYVLTINLETDPPEILERLVAELMKGYDIVLGRFKEGELRKKSMLLSFILYVIGRLSRSGFVFSLNYCSGVSRKVVNAISRMNRRQRSFSYMYSFIGFRKKIITYVPDLSHIDKKHLAITKILSSVIDSAISNSARPLRIATFAGMAAGFINLVYILYVFIVAQLKKDVAEGWITTSLLTSSMFFVTFFILTIISEYLLRILNESRHDPTYFITDEYDSSVYIEDKASPLNVV
ncbi:MAG: glycosyltransferase [Patescibacteria group bacterium]|nr:glycosyltransferase [Patescibacteria group bacterium]